jgi:hypothetical protein
MLADALAQVISKLALAVDVFPGRQHDQTREYEAEVGVPLRPYAILHLAIQHSEQLSLQLLGEVTDLIQ